MKNSRYVDQFDIHHSFSTLKLLLEGETNQFNLSNSRFDNITFILVDYIITLLHYYIIIIL